MLNFMHEVYFEAERIQESVEFQSSLWEIFRQILDALHLYPQLTVELRRDDGFRYFIFQAVMPFLRVFFASHYDLQGRALASGFGATYRRRACALAECRCCGCR